MDIYNRLPEDIQHKMFIYFRHPIAQQLHNYPWVIPQVIKQWPSVPTTKYRISLAKMVANPIMSRKRCGCIYYEQHQVCCNDLPEEELKIHGTQLYEQHQYNKQSANPMYVQN